MKKYILLVVIAMYCNAAFSQAQLVKNINATTSLQSSSPSKFVNINGTVYFSAYNVDSGYELWKTDGTNAGTLMVKDIQSGTGSSSPNNLTNVNGTLYFSAGSNGLGVELWKSDGTEEGTVLVKDINPATNSAILSSPSQFAVLGSTVYFMATDGTTGYELWKSDGTDAGTVLVKDIISGSTSSNPGSLISMGSYVYFTATDGTSGYELWKSDGTSGGTVMVKDIWTGYSSSSPAKLMVIGSTLFFRASDSTASGYRGVELWKSNGTTIGTAQVKDIYSGINSSTPDYLTAIGTTLYFSAYNPTYGQELWRCDPPYGSANTVMVADINPNVGNSSPQYMTNVNGILFFSAYDPTNGTELWLSGGDSTTTGMVKDIYPGFQNASPSLLTAKNNVLYFVANEPSGGSELWRSDGTVNGTYQVKDIETGSASSNPGNLFSNGDFLVFSASTSTSGVEPWVSDGTSGGTNLLYNVNPEIGSGAPMYITNLNDTVYFMANDGINGTELWKSDGTTGGTVIVKDIYPGANGSMPTGNDGIMNINGTLFFAAFDGVNGYELWKSNGTANGTVMVKDIYPGVSNSYPSHFMNVNGVLYFFANNGTSGNELWKSDGTPGGTVMVQDINPGAANSLPTGSLISMMVNYNNKLYFEANDGTNGNELWQSDGTSGGTILVQDIYTGPGSSSPGGLTVCNGKLFFYATYPTLGIELSMSDGTPEGTSILADIYPGSFSSSPNNFFDMNGTLMFGANDGINGNELWKSDGTPGGTVMVKDLYTGSTSSGIASFKYVNGITYFRGKDANGLELWKTDGSTAGTVMIKDINPGANTSAPTSMTNFHDTLFFVARTDLNGQEIFVSTGTAQTTALAADIFPGIGWGSPQFLTATTNAIFFSATDGTNGKELWKLTMPAALQSTSTVTNLLCNGGSTGAINLTVTGGTPPYSYLWSTAETTEDISGLAAGNYSVVITDAWGWSLTKNFTITQPNATTVSLTSQTNVTCNGGSNGAINISITGGSSPYTYLWSPGGATTQNISGLTANTYSVVVTDALGCTKNFSSAITQPQPIAATTNTSNTTCYAGTNGTATVNVTVGVAPCTYLWSANAGSQTSQTATGLSAGTYTVVVTDYTGCQKTLIDSLTQPTAFVTGTISTDVNCNGGSNGAVDLTVSGASPTYTYLWSNNATTQDLTNVAAATYTVTITDSQGCTKTLTAAVGQPAIFSANMTKTDITCHGLINGTATATVSGGTSPYFYSWQIVPVQNTQTATGLGAGLINVTITDNHGCVITPNVSISEPTALTVSFSKSDATCGNNNGSATASPSGGTSPYGYLWTPSSATTATASGLPSGNYSVTVTDFNGCTNSASGTVNTIATSQQICMVTVDTLSTHTIIYWEKPSVSGLDSFKIYREVTTNNYVHIGSVSYGSLSEYHDYAADPNVTSYKYKITVLDSCGNESALSDYHNTIHLQNLGSGNLQWTLYGIENATNPVNFYRVYRDDINTGNYLPISLTIPGGNSTYTDVNYSLYPNANYRVDVAWSISCSPTRAIVNTTRSNIKHQGIVSSIADDIFNSISIYPNPANESVTIELGRQTGIISLKIINVLGQLMEDETVVPSSATKTLKQINVSGYAKGIYTVCIENNGKKIFKKLVVN